MATKRIEVKKRPVVKIRATPAAKTPRLIGGRGRETRVKPDSKVKIRY